MIGFLYLIGCIITPVVFKTAGRVKFLHQVPKLSQTLGSASSPTTDRQKWKHDHV